MGVTAVNLLDDIIQQYQLTPFDQRSGALDTIKLVIATGQAIHGFHYAANLARPSFTVHAPPSQAISALTKIATVTGNLIAFATSAGQLHLLNDQGMCLEQRQISTSPLWSITSAQVGQQLLLFATAADSTIRVCDSCGALLGTIETPGPVLSLAIKLMEGKTILLGGLRNKNHVCVWDLQAVIQRQDAAPIAILQGGRQPAFATTFIERIDSLWLAHGCWDNRLYFYHWPPGNGRKIISPFLQLKAPHPIYSIQSVAFDNDLYLLASTANGDVLAWDIMNGKNSDMITVARLGTRVKQMKAVKLGNQWYLLAGDGNGRLTIAHLTDNLYLSEIVNTLTTNNGDIRGIEIING